MALFDREIAPYIRELTTQFWIPPHIISKNIIEKLSKISPFICLYNQVIASGEIDNISIYLIREENLIIFTPFGDVQNNIVFLHTLPEVLIKYNDNLYLVKKNEKILDRLALPKVVLINPSVIDIFPMPRLALCVASLAGYLRKYQKADVHIIDMQIGPTIDMIIKEIKDTRPDIIGISISFGQINLAVFILERIFNSIEIMKRKPKILAGNVIASFGYQELLRKFPELIICKGEGERTIVGLVDHIKGKKTLKDVPGIRYIENGKIKETSTIEIDMDEAPLPAMDTLEGIIKNKGALTMEVSRGCYHSACTFCPRTYKPRKWKGMSSNIVLKQLEHYKHIFDSFGIERRIFMADEEFIGWMHGDKNVKRIIEISKGIIDRNLNIRFETDIRIDQIYNLQNDKEWHIEHMKMLSLCKKAGLERLLVGVESGSDTVLERFNKKIKANDSVIAIRILTSLGIGLRVTFITFDPLMNFSELKENIHFLERKDIFLKKIDLLKIDYSNLFEMVHDTKFVINRSQNHPFYQNVAYMVVNLEVLINSKYFDMMNKYLETDKEPDYNMARYRAPYVDKIIGDIAFNCQKWIDRNFALDYCLKGLYKVASNSERKRLFNFRANYRELTFLLLKSLAWIFDKEDSINLQANLSDLKDIIDDLEILKHNYQSLGENREKIIISVLDLFNRKMLLLIDTIEEAIGINEINDDTGKLNKVIQQWKEQSEWTLINP